MTKQPNAKYTGVCKRCGVVFTAVKPPPDDFCHTHRRYRYPKKREEANARTRARYASDPEYRARLAAAKSRWYDANREKINKHIREFDRLTRALNRDYEARQVAEQIRAAMEGGA